MKSLCYAVFFTFFLFPSAFAEFQGGTVGNGGDRFAIEFISNARRTLELLESHRPSRFSTIELRRAIARTVVESTDRELLINGVVKDAINFADRKLIVISRQAWGRIQNERVKSLLVLHEYLGIMKIDDSRYSESSRLLQAIYKDLIVCVSIHLNAESRGEAAGRATLKLGEDSETAWEDSLHTYKVYSSAKNLNFTLSYDELNGSQPKMLKAHLDANAPYFSFSFPYSTNKKVLGLSIENIEVECK